MTQHSTTFKTILTNVDKQNERTTGVFAIAGATESRSFGIF